MQKLANGSTSTTQVAAQNATAQIYPTFNTISSCNFETHVVQSNPNIVNDMNIASRCWNYFIDSFST